LGVKSKVNSASSRQVDQVIGSHPPFVPTPSKHRHLIKIVPYIVRRIRKSSEMLSILTIFNSVLVGYYRHASHCMRSLVLSQYLLHLTELILGPSGQLSYIPALKGEVLRKIE
jgi:hypothetical protein